MADTETLNLDWDAFTLGELEDLEDLSGTPFAKVNPLAPPLKVLIAAICIVKRRSDPTFTMEDARKLPITVLPEGKVNGSQRPTRAGKPAAGRR